MSADEVYDRIQPHVRNIGTTGHGADCTTCRSFIGRSTHETELLDEVARHLAEVATETEDEPLDTGHFCLGCRVFEDPEFVDEKCVVCGCDDDAHMRANVILA